MVVTGVPAPIPYAAKVKYFGFFAPEKWNVDRISGYYNKDTTQVSTSSTTRTNFKTYTPTFNVSGLVRVRVYAHIGSSSYVGYVYLNIDGTDVASNSTSATTSTLLIDYVGSVSSGAHTIKVDGYMSNSLTSLSIDTVVIVQGAGFNSTTTTTAFSSSLESYSLYDGGGGDFKYSVGVAYKIVYHRKTTASYTFNVNGVAPQWADLSVVDDGDNTVTGYGEAPYQSTLAITGSVGASGNCVIILNMYVQVTLRSNQSTSHCSNCRFVSFAKGFHYIYGKAYAIDVASYMYVNRDDPSLSNYFIATSVSVSAGATAIANYQYTNTSSLIVNSDIKYSGFIFLEVIAVSV